MTDELSAQPGRAQGVAPRRAPPLLLYVVTAAAVLFGLWARFKGLGSWPLHADEYYIARSVQNILRTGLPEYACGGFYLRGLIFQYAVALLQTLGLSAELAPRLIAAVASLAVLPAAYLLGVRVHGRTVGLIAVAVLAVSMWEVDLARFGRMYAPFQAVFAWYLLYFIRYTVDRETRALWPMLVLSIVGVFTWEGGIFMTLANLLPPFLRNPTGKLTARDLRFLAFAAIPVVLAYGFTITPFRTLGTDPFPPGFIAGGAYVRQARDSALFAMPASAAAWIAAMIALTALAGLVVSTARWIWSLRDRWPAALGLTVALGCALAGQFAAVVVIVVIILLAGMLEWRELVMRRAWPFTVTILCSAMGWTALLLHNPQWLSSIEIPWGRSNWVLSLAYELLRFPDFIGVLAVPWSRSAPILGAMLLALITLASLRAIRRGRQAPSADGVILVLLIALLAGVSMSDPPRFETRYVFFLLPAAIVIAITMVATAVNRWVRAEAVAALATLAIAAAGLAIAGDFKPRRLLTIDSATINFGLDIGPHEKSNTLNRSDPRGAAMWLTKNAGDPRTVVINGYPGVDFYYSGFDFAYIDTQNQRYAAYACNHGTVERWGNLPLVASVNELNARIAGRNRALVVVETARLEAVLTKLRGPRPRVAWTSADGAISILDTGAAPSRE